MPPQWNGAADPERGRIPCCPPGQLPYGYFHSPGLATKLRAKCDSDMAREEDPAEDLVT